MEIRKAIIPAAGLGTRFLPLSKVLPKELWPLVDKPVIHYIVEEAIQSGIREIIFVIKPGRKEILDYFKKYLKKMPELEEVLKVRKKDQILKELKNLEKIFRSVSFSYVFQKAPLGDGQAVLQAEKLIREKPCAVLYDDDVVESRIPCLSQIIKVFKKYQQPVMALSRVPKESFPLYGMVGGEKIGNRTYLIREIVEKPSIEKSPSNLAIVGKRIITREVFDYLKKTPLSKRGEIGLTEALAEMVKDGKKVYGYEIEGKWLECGNKIAYLKSNLYLSLKHPRFGRELKKFLKEERLI
jgi:UTP--glucose-1-phosphate uridylyltransferase